MSSLSQSGNRNPVEEAAQNAAIVPVYATAAAAAAETSPQPTCYVQTTKTHYYYCSNGTFPVDSLSVITITAGGQWVGFAGQYILGLNIVGGTLTLNGFGLVSPLGQLFPVIQGNFFK
jgi:hypothetical protein